MNARILSLIQYSERRCKEHALPKLLRPQTLVGHTPILNLNIEGGCKKFLYSASAAAELAITLALNITCDISSAAGLPHIKSTMKQSKTTICNSELLKVEVH